MCVQCAEIRGLEGCLELKSAPRSRGGGMGEMGVTCQFGNIIISPGFGGWAGYMRKGRRVPGIVSYPLGCSELCLVGGGAGIEPDSPIQNGCHSHLASPQGSFREQGPWSHLTSFLTQTFGHCPVRPWEEHLRPSGNPNT